MGKIHDVATAAGGRGGTHVDSPSSCQSYMLECDGETEALLTLLQNPAGFVSTSQRVGFSEHRK